MPEIMTLQGEVLMLAHSFVGFSSCWLNLMFLGLWRKNILPEESVPFIVISEGCGGRSSDYCVQCLA